MITPMFHFSFLIFQLTLFVPRLATSQNDCPQTRCTSTGPSIRFPFWLKGHQAEECGFPGFSLSCSSTNETELEFEYPLQATANNIKMFFPVKVVVQDIDYRKQVIHISSISTTYCLPNQTPGINSSSSSFTSVFAIVDDNYPGYTLFNCSAVNGKVKLLYNRGHTVSCLSHSNEYQILAMESYYSVSDFPMPACKKMYNISHVPSEFFGGQESRSFSSLDLHWSEPLCENCESQGKYCRLINKTSTNSTECYDIPAQQENEDDSSKKKMIAGISVGVSILCVLVVCAIHLGYRYNKKQDYKKRVAQFLDDYKALRPTRYSYADVKKITAHFKEKLGQGGYGTVYKGKLSNEILVAVKVLDHVKGNGEDFINEVGTIGRVHHVNVVRLIGYCADGYRRALVYEFLPNESLGTYISSRRGNKELGYEKLQQIAIGIAKGLDYLHQGCNQRILHFDVKPQNILLDNKFIPKVADFGLAKLSSKDESMVAMTAARGTVGYIAPEVFSRNYGNVTYKADIYSFGMLLLDMVGGRKKFTAAEDDNTQSSEIYFPEWMFNQLEKGKEISIQIDNEEDKKIFKILAIVGLWCIQWYPADRPSMKVVIQMLEGEDIPIMPPNPFTSTKSPIYVGESESSSGSKSYSSSFYSISD
ncbi:hypothetical protein LIER_30555 [Lithospermum erythrorhizon]|uniref:Protein kinase domain-containing protein n=1 Tax=Lithospermum erythrorhizon TaxID=34254 RepID=A0AAV3RRR3_LITER